ncbi:MAG: hypothetical protein ACOYD6_04185 [Limnochordia bacterium]|jgi:hypothetical protein
MGDCPCPCPEGLVPFLDERVLVMTKAGEIKGILRGIGDTFLEIEEKDYGRELTVIPCGQICSIRHLR